MKVLAPELATDPEFRARFTREAKAISALNHPHICGLHDIGREHDTEYLASTTLSDRLDQFEGHMRDEKVLEAGVRGNPEIIQLTVAGVALAQLLRADDPRLRSATSRPSLELRLPLLPPCANTG